MLEKMQDREINPVDKERVIDFMMKYHCGYKNACPRHKIAETLNMPDRYFRDVCAGIDEIITSVKFGYYILPLWDVTGEESRQARDILKGEDQRRIIALYLRQRRQRKAIYNMEGNERQLELPLVGAR